MHYVLVIHDITITFPNSDAFTYLLLEPFNIQTLKFIRQMPTILCNVRNLSSLYAEFPPKLSISLIVISISTDIQVPRILKSSD